MSSIITIIPELIVAISTAKKNFSKLKTWMSMARFILTMP